MDNLQRPLVCFLGYNKIQIRYGHSKLYKTAEPDGCDLEFGPAGSSAIRSANLKKTYPRTEHEQRAIFLGFGIFTQTVRHPHTCQRIYAEFTTTWQSSYVRRVLWITYVSDSCRCCATFVRTISVVRPFMNRATDLFGISGDAYAAGKATAVPTRMSRRQSMVNAAPTLSWEMEREIQRVYLPHHIINLQQL